MFWRIYYYSRNLFITNLTTVEENFPEGKKLNLGCGYDYKEGWINVDQSKDLKCDVVCDVAKDVFPFKDDSVNYILASHLVEHLPGIIHFMNECHRVLKKGGTLKIITPHPLSEFFWTDPTHVRGYSPGTFKNYFVKSTFATYGIKPWSKAIVKIHKWFIDDLAISWNMTGKIMFVWMTK